MKNNKVTIKIPRQLYNKIQQLVEDSGFNSATDFIVFVLRDLISETGSAADSAGARDESDQFSPDELAALKKKLRNLGYL
jgi:Arc/MetJ-type ribon-helix-helix transcriptional regulator